MEIVKTIVLILEVIVSVLLTVVILFQSGKEAGLSGAIGGGNGSSYMGKGKSKSLDAKLAGATKWIAAAFVVLTVASLAMIALTSKNNAPAASNSVDTSIVETVDVPETEAATEADVVVE